MGVFSIPGVLNGSYIIWIRLIVGKNLPKGLFRFALFGLKLHEFVDFQGPTHATLHTVQIREFKTLLRRLTRVSTNYSRIWKLFSLHLLR